MDSDTTPEQKVSRRTKEKENRQLFWLFFWVLLVFAAFIIPYFYKESLKHFEFGAIDWTVEQYQQLTIYHGRFTSFNDVNNTYNLFLRIDPRKNDALVQGNFSSFKVGGYIAISPKLDECRGELSRALLDFGSFVKKGIGVGQIEVATTDKELA